MVAAASGLMPGGRGCSASALVSAWVAKAAGAKPKTAAPACRPTPGPASSTTPAHSMPRLGPAKPSISMSSGNNPCAHITSRKLRPVAVTRSRTSPGPGFGKVSAALQPRLANCPGWPMANCAGKPGAGAGKPGRISGAKRPPAARLISGASPAHSARINGAASSGGRSGAMVSRRGLSPGISFAKTRPSPISAAARASSA